MNSESSKLSISLVQTQLAWEDPAANRAHFDECLLEIGATDLIVLPEMFSTGFSMDSRKLAEPMSGETLAWMKAKARELNASLCGSVITVDEDEYFNRFILVTPEGELSKYDKRHLFRMSTENDNYSAGTDRLSFSINGFNIFPQVCYDLRFPVFSRNNLNFDVMLYVANWPKVRREHWMTLLRARAIENLCYVVGLNRIGTDGNNVDYSGDSMVIDFNGSTLIDMQCDDSVRTIEIEKAALVDYRERFPAWKDADKFSLD